MASYIIVVLYTDRSDRPCRGSIVPGGTLLKASTVVYIAMNHNGRLTAHLAPLSGVTCVVGLYNPVIHYHRPYTRSIDSIAQAPGAS